LWQIPAPEGLYNKTFNELFLYLLERNLIAIALYRMPGATDNKYPYVFTNPEGATINLQDKVFVIGEEVPKELNLGIEDSHIHENTIHNVFTQYAHGNIVK
jgi:hypothetical protein